MAENIGDRIHRYRKRKGLTQQELASQIGWYQPAVSALEKGARRRLDIVDAYKIAHALDIRVSDLLSEADGTVMIESPAVLTKQWSWASLASQMESLSPRQQDEIGEIVTQIVQLMNGR